MLCKSGALSALSIGRNLSVPTHLLYVDDILLFCKASKSNMETIKFAIDTYGDLSGQSVSLEKSKVYFWQICTIWHV